jgi:drug/metabolite transporter (DMT)-like permease
MTPSIALWASIALGACAQVFLKKGVSGKNAASRSGYFALLLSGWVWAWALCFALATGLWLIALAKIQVSYAFPLLSLGYPIVAVLSMLLLKERVNVPRWIAILVITIGVAIIWQSS